MLIVRLSSIGDIALTTPLIRAVRRRYPSAQIDFVVKREFAELLRTNPYLNQVYEYEARTGVTGLISLAASLRRHHYDLYVDIHNNLRSHLLRYAIQPTRSVTYSKQTLRRMLLLKFKINRYAEILQVPDRYLQPLRQFGVVNDELGLELFPTPAQYAKVQAIFERERLAETELTIGFGPIAAHPLKQWGLEKFVELGKELVQRFGARILLFGGQREVIPIRRLAEQIPNAPVMFAGELSLLETAAAVRRCAAFVGNDTGIAHIAAAMQRKVVVFFGPTVEEFGFYPYRTPSRVLCKSLPCRPCTPTGKGRCKIRTHACLKNITVKDAIAAIESVLKEKTLTQKDAD